MRIRSLRSEGELCRQKIAAGEWVYCGRGMADLKDSPLGNPFPLRDYTSRTECLEAYRKWLWQRIKANDNPIIRAINALTPDSTLVCWCCCDDAPESCERGEEHCHCHVVVKVYLYLKGQQK